MGKKKSLTRDDLIAKIELRLQQPDVPIREFTSLTKRLANLKGFIKQGEYRRVPATQPEPQEPDVLPRWWSDDWAKIYISEKARGLHPALNAVMYHELDRFEANWAAQENLSVPELREALRRESAEWKVQHSNEERLGYFQMRQIEWDRAHPAQYLGVKPEETTND